MNFQEKILETFRKNHNEIERTNKGDAKRLQDAYDAAHRESVEIISTLFENGGMSYN